MVLSYSSRSRQEQFGDSFIESYGGEEAFQEACRKDQPAVSLDWGVYTDNLCRDGVITSEEYHNWSCPI